MTLAYLQNWNLIVVQTQVCTATMGTFYKWRQKLATLLVLLTHFERWRHFVRPLVRILGVRHISGIQKLKERDEF